MGETFLGTVVIQGVAFRVYGPAGEVLPRFNGDGTAKVLLFGPDFRVVPVAPEPPLMRYEFIQTPAERAAAQEAVEKYNQRRGRVVDVDPAHVVGE